MSTTLTNGLKLPDKGSVDWYADMQNNYAILDGAVGTVAEHTSALSGKAPLVHTHTKSDITDLFNSANEWTDLQSYTQSIKFKMNFTVGAAPSSDLYGGFNFGNMGTNIGNVTARVNSTGATYSRLYIGNKFANGALDPNGTWKYVELQVGLKANGDRFIYTDGLWRNSLTPYDSTVSIGDSNHQWNNLYAKNYYYNGVAWGLDKANVWSAENTYTNILLTLKHTALEVGVLPASNQTKRCRFTDKNNADLGWLQHRVNVSGDSYLEIYAVNKFSNGQFSPQGSDVANSLIVGLHSDGTRYAQIMSDFVPAYTNLNCNLGTSTNKWKTFNDINPGALSLPNSPGGTGTENVNYYDLSGNITVRDGHTFNRYTAPCDGWIAIGTFATWLQISNDTLILATTANPGADGFAQAFLPVRKGNAIRIVVNQTNTQFQSFKLLPCEGNV